MGVLESNKWTFEFNDNLRDKVDGHFIEMGRSRKFEVNGSKISMRVIIDVGDDFS